MKEVIQLGLELFEGNQTLCLILKFAQFHVPMLVTQLMVFPNTTYYVCPCCKITLEREFMSFCDRCGQRLDWQKYRSAQIVYPGTVRNDWPIVVTQKEGVYAQKQVSSIWPRSACLNNLVAITLDKDGGLGAFTEAEDGANVVYSLTFPIPWRASQKTSLRPTALSRKEGIKSRIWTAIKRHYSISLKADLSLVNKTFCLDKRERLVLGQRASLLPNTGFLLLTSLMLTP